MMKVIVNLPDNIAAVFKYHCTCAGISSNTFIKGLVYAELRKEYPDLLEKATKEAVNT